MMDLDDAFALKSAFQLIPQGQKTPGGCWQGASERGFEVNLHDLNHDGYLFSSRRIS